MDSHFRGNDNLLFKWIVAVRLILAAFGQVE